MNFLKNICGIMGIILIVMASAMILSDDVMAPTDLLILALDIFFVGNFFRTKENNG